jgi:hypothetical protein
MGYPEYFAFLREKRLAPGKRVDFERKFDASILNNLASFGFSVRLFLAVNPGRGRT